MYIRKEMIHIAVLASNRTVSSLEFIKSLREIEVIFLQMYQNKPKKYHFFIRKLIDLSMDAYNSAVLGNSILPKNSYDYNYREILIKKSIGLTYIILSQIEILYAVYNKDSISTGQIKDLSNHCNIALISLKGLLEADNKRFYKYNELNNSK